MPIKPVITVISLLHDFFTGKSHTTDRFYRAPGCCHSLSIVSGAYQPVEQLGAYCGKHVVASRTVL